MMRQKANERTRDSERSLESLKLYSKHVDIIPCKVRRIIVAFPSRTQISSSLALVALFLSPKRDFSLNREKANTHTALHYFEFSGWEASTK
jgi:hypothetical protein